MSVISTFSHTVRKDFVRLRPVIQHRARLAFRHLHSSNRDESVAEAVAAAFQSHARLQRRGIDPGPRFAGRMADFAIRHVRDGRHVGGSRSSTDALSFRAQRLGGFRVESLTQSPHERSADTVFERLIDNTRSPVPDQAAFRIDFPQFLQSLSQRDRTLARFLALGHSAMDAAARMALSPGRVTQLRQQWQRDWMRSQSERGEPPVINSRRSCTPARS